MGGPENERNSLAETNRRRSLTTTSSVPEGRRGAETAPGSRLPAQEIEAITRRNGVSEGPRRQQAGCAAAPVERRDQLGLPKVRPRKESALAGPEKEIPGGENWGLRRQPVVGCLGCGVAGFVTLTKTLGGPFDETSPRKG